MTPKTTDNLKELEAIASKAEPIAPADYLRIYESIVTEVADYTFSLFEMGEKPWAPRPISFFFGGEKYRWYYPHTEAPKSKDPVNKMLGLLISLDTESYYSELHLTASYKGRLLVPELVIALPEKILKGQYACQIIEDIKYGLLEPFFMQMSERYHKLENQRLARRESAKAKRRAANAA